jgi:hypothetical protein
MRSTQVALAILVTFGTGFHVKSLVLTPGVAPDRPASQQLGNGEIYDFELVPAVPGDLRINVTTGAGGLLATVPIRVR